MPGKFTNSLINESSPYLLQHAHNPVNWFAWSDEALAKAKAENKVILISIGYSACHWCHVMERESFENEAVAEIMNAHFINIKIDREERPDLDHIYMDAVQAISGSGGWPLNVFLTPDAKPFFGGTYYPPVKAFNRSSWTDLLMGINKAWVEKRNEIESQADNLLDHLQNSNNLIKSGIGNVINKENELVSKQQAHLMFEAIMKTADTTWGGFGKAPKFPQTFTIQYLLQYHYFTKNEEALQQALLSIDKMLEGGIYDHIAGGLARYSTDVEWLAPHFEKMLYDNALLINILCDAFQITGNSKYENAIRKTISFITTELLDENGGFYAALDADSEGEEGKYYVWSKLEVDEILGNDSAMFCNYFDISEEGNWEEKNILRILNPIHEFIQEQNIDRDKFIQFVQSCLHKLKLKRDERVKPALDDKIILSWNALMIKAIAKAGIVLQEETFTKLAETNFEFIKKNFSKTQSEVELLHTFKSGKANYPGFLDDYAYLISACIQLYKSTFNEKYLTEAYNYTNYVIQNFSDNESIFFFFTHFEQKNIILRKKEIYDGATPSGNSIMAENLLTLSLIFDQADWKIRAEKMLELIIPSAIKYPGSFGIWSSIILQQIIGIQEVAIVGSNHINLSKKLLLNYLPNLVIMSSSKENDSFPLLKSKINDRLTQVYICKDYACMAPLTEIDEAIIQINRSNLMS